MSVDVERVEEAPIERDERDKMCAGAVTAQKDAARNVATVEVNMFSRPRDRTCDVLDVGCGRW
jgi:hypothetical protein